MINLFVDLDILTNGEITDANTTKIKASQLPTEIFIKTAMQRQINNIFSTNFSNPLSSLSQSIILCFIFNKYQYNLSKIQ